MRIGDTRYYSEPSFDYKIISQPATTPVSLQECKDWMKVSWDNDDNLIEGLINTAVTKAQEYCSLALITQTIRLGIKDYSEEVELPYGPHQSISRVIRKYKDETKTLTEGSGYHLDGSCPNMFYTIYPDTVYRTSIGAVPYRLIIDFVAGYGDEPENVPQVIREALKLMVANAYEYRNVEDLKAVDVYMDMKVKSKLNLFKRYWM